MSVPDPFNVPVSSPYNFSLWVLWGQKCSSSVLQWSAQETSRRPPSSSKTQTDIMNHPLHRVAEVKERIWVPNASVILQSKTWQKQCWSGDDTCVNACEQQTKVCAKSSGSCSLLTTDFPCPLSPLPLLDILYWQGHCEDHWLWGQTQKALCSWKMTYKLQVLIWQQEYLCLKWNCCCNVDLLTAIVVANSAIFQLWISKHIRMER